MTPAELEKIKQAIYEFFQKTGLLVEIEIGKPQDFTIPVNLKMEDPQVLIGERGQTLADTQRLLKLMLKKMVPQEEPFYLDIDVNDYKKKKTEYLKEMARSAADEVSLNKKEKELPAMSPYERRVIHMELSQRSDIATESIGDGLDRRVVIRVRS